MGNDDYFHGESGLNEKISQSKLNKLLEIAYNLRRAFAEGKEIEEKELAEAKVFLAMLLEYLIKNRDNPNVDVSLIEFLEKVLGVKRSKDKVKEPSLQEKEAKRVMDEYKKHRQRMVMYEIYKVINPNQLAGETKFENFLNNLVTRGLHVARQYNGKEYENMFTTKEIENIASYGNIFKELIKETGTRGKGI